MNYSNEAWIDWKKTTEGQSALQGNAGGPYLENRLWFAFMAGFSAGKSLVSYVKDPVTGEMLIKLRKP